MLILPVVIKKQAKNFLIGASRKPQFIIKAEVSNQQRAAQLDFSQVKEEKFKMMKVFQFQSGENKEYAILKEVPHSTK